MFGGRQSGNNVPQNAGKDTLHISPHIAAHKSNSQSNGENFLETSQDHCLSNSRLTSIQAIGHVPSGYRIGIPTSAIFSEPFQNSRNQTTHLQVPTIFTLPSSKALPQDLSSHSKLSTNHENENTNSKSLPHIHNVGNQNVENITSSFIVPVPDRSPAYYRLVDGTTISISNQHQTVLVSAQNDDHSGGHIGHLNPVRQSHHGENSAIVTSSGAMTMSSVSEPSHSHISLSGLSEGQLYVVPPQVITNGNNFLSSDALLPEKLKAPAIDDVKIESDEHKDLVRQALQAAVHNSHKTNSGQDIIAYDYGGDNIGDPGDCMVNEDVICHSTFCSQPNVKTQELLLMNVNVNQGHQSGNKLGSVVVGSAIQENPNGGQVMVLDASQSIDEAGNILPPIILSSRRRRTKLSEEAQAMRREKIANRMREKRANESQEQKEKRRLREAERMRRKRAQEDENSKERRRREAAERARMRRAKLSNEERELERKKAAARMRLRRQNENEEQKRLRRIKAAERMRKRRSAETPEERAARKRNIALRMKVKRQKKEEKENNEVNNFIHSSENETIYSKEEDDKESLSNADTGVQNLNVSHHLVVSSGSLEDVPENLTLLQNEGPNVGGHLLTQSAASILSAVELTHVTTPISHSLKTSLSPVEQKDLRNTSEKNGMCASSKNISGEDQENHHLQLSPSASRNSESPVHQVKDLHLHHHHHLPHLLHHHPSHQETHNHSIYILPHASSSQMSHTTPIHLEQQ